MSFWRKNGKLVGTSAGVLTECATCPCENVSKIVVDGNYFNPGGIKCDEASTCEELGYPMYSWKYEQYQYHYEKEFDPSTISPQGTKDIELIGYISWIYGPQCSGNKPATSGVSYNAKLTLNISRNGDNWLLSHALPRSTYVPFFAIGGGQYCYYIDVTNMPLLSTHFNPNPDPETGVRYISVGDGGYACSTVPDCCGTVDNLVYHLNSNLIELKYLSGTLINYPEGSQVLSGYTTGTTYPTYDNPDWGWPGYSPGYLKGNYSFIDKTTVTIANGDK